MPHATPRSVANVVTRPSASMRCTLPSNRLDTCSRPPGSKASEVGFARSETNGSREPSGLTMKIATGPSCPREPLKVTYRLPVGVEGGAVDLVQAGRQRRTDLHIGRLAEALRRCAPACGRRRAPPARSRSAPAARRSPAAPEGRRMSGAGRDRPRKPVPAMVTCAAFHSPERTDRGNARESWKVSSRADVRCGDGLR